MIVYFSGTGNSRFVAEYMAKQLQDEVINANQMIKAGETLTASSNTPWVFVAPIYGWQLPHVFADFIRCAQLARNKDAYFVLTCGSDVGNAGEYAQQLAAEKGLTYCGILEVVMPENYVAMFPVPDAEESAAIVKKALPGIQAGITCIQQGKPFPNRRITGLDRFKSGIVNHWFYKLCVKATGFYAKDSCIGCGKCADLCPLNNIRLAQGRPVWAQNCTHCMACICSCPTEAIEYGKKSIGKPRYHCPSLE